MRARSLKPSIFKNELLAVADPLYTVIFAGLWCAADREGRLEDRPVRLHMEINPGRSYEGTTQALDWLAANGFITRYEAAGTKYICIPAFLKHQRPHQNEKPSVIPEPDLLPRCEVMVDQGNKHFALTPDSGLLTPDSSPPESTTASNEARAKPADKNFDEFRRAFPRRVGSQPWGRARKAINARLSEGSTWGQILSGATRYAEFCKAVGKAGTEFVMQAATFCGPDRHYLEPWTPPPSKSQTKQDANVAASVAWLEGRT